MATSVYSLLPEVDVIIIIIIIYSIYIVAPNPEQICSKELYIKLN